MYIIEGGVDVKIDKQAVLTGLSAIFGVGAFVVNALSEKGKAEEIAKRAAEIVKESQQHVSE